MKLDADRKNYMEELIKWKEEFSEASGKTDNEKEKYLKTEINMNVQKRKCILKINGIKLQQKELQKRKDWKYTSNN
jgi:hypothetical protein